MMRHGWRFCTLILIGLIGASLVSTVEARDRTPYKDLPGVKVPGSETQAGAACTSRIRRPYWGSRHTRLSRRVYRCEVENVIIESTRPPDEIDWKKRQRYYKPWMADGFDR